MMRRIAAVAASLAAAQAVCPLPKGEIRYGSHAIPKQVFYTGRTDGHLQNLTFGARGQWPDDFEYYFFDNAALERSMRVLGTYMASEVEGIYEAFEMLRPWAYRADLWRYCILWACGGVYVDSKLALAEPFHEFVWNAGFNPTALSASSAPQLYSCRDDLCSESMHRKSRLLCLWQGLLIAEPGNPAFLSTIRFVVDKIKERWYPPMELSKMPWLFLTGPGAIALATQIDDKDWEAKVKLRCRMTYTPKTQLREPLKNPHLVGDWHLIPGANYTVYDAEMEHSSFVADAGLHETQRTNDYGKLFKTHLVYMDDEFNATFALTFRRPHNPKKRRWGHLAPGHVAHYATHSPQHRLSPR
mmetsp:Transcript_2058/g.6241  ORF Transcript_2058/g.6241 Transcript_2058/m.6241 type:complete len:357 (+) Transcript_2058:233-1303(+)